MKNKISSYLAYIFIRILTFSLRIKFFGLENFSVALRRSKGGFCLGTWHEHLFLGIVGGKAVPYCLLVSRSKDGDFVDFVAKKLGYYTARGSSSRGGNEARVVLKKYIMKGYPAAFTVDGPRGPRQKCKAGLLKAAIETNAMILPVVAVANKHWTLSKTWDQTKLPKPFSKVVYQFGKPIKVDENLSGQDFDDKLKFIGEAIKNTELQAFNNLSSWDKGQSSISSYFSKHSINFPK